MCTVYLLCSLSMDLFYSIFLVDKELSIYRLVKTMPIVQSRKVPTSYHRFDENGATTHLPYLKPSDILSHLLRDFPYLLLGGLDPGPEANRLLGAFWRQYRLEHPSHDVYKRATRNEVSLEYVIPLLIHGDGGRTLKKQPLECISIQAALGLDTMSPPKPCTCCQPATYGGLDFNDPMVQRLNHKHHSYLTHFLVSAFPSKEYRKFPGLLMSILGQMSEDLEQVCLRGLDHGGNRYWFALLGFKADLEYAAKSGMLTRSYQNVGTRNDLPCCHQYLAGGPLFPFEDFGDQAQWKNTCLRDPPWTRTRQPPFSHLSFEPWNTGRAALWFRHDIFHIFRLGVARNFIGSAIVLLAFDSFFDAPGDGIGLDARLVRAWSHFVLWCDAHSATPSGIRSFSRQKLHMQTQTSFPYVGCKGADSILLLRWLKWFTGLQLQSNPGSAVLRLICDGCDAGLRLQKIHGHGIWLKRGCKMTVRSSTKRFLAVYAHLAQLALNRRMTLFSMVPKLHSLDHFAHDLDKSFDNEYSLNPAIFDCSMSEDFVGRVSRQSRRISYRNHVQNTLLAYKVKACFVIKRFKDSRHH